MNKAIPIKLYKARTIELNPRKIQNDPILPNPAKTVSKNLLEFADGPILPLWMNQAKTIWKKSKPRNEKRNQRILITRAGQIPGQQLSFWRRMTMPMIWAVPGIFHLSKG